MNMKFCEVRNLTVACPNTEHFEGWATNLGWVEEICFDGDDVILVHYERNKCNCEE